MHAFLISYQQLVPCFPRSQVGGEGLQAMHVCIPGP